MIQLILHLLGDYVNQSTWMAKNKTKASWPAFVHATIYSVPFLFITDVKAWLVIYITHFFMDRFRLVRYITYMNSFISPKAEWKTWGECKETGFHKDTPPWMATWLMILADNI